MDGGGTAETLVLIALALLVLGPLAYGFYVNNLRSQPGQDESRLATPSNDPGTRTDKSRAETVAELAMLSAALIVMNSEKAKDMARSGREILGQCGYCLKPFVPSDKPIIGISWDRSDLSASELDDASARIVLLCQQPEDFNPFNDHL